LRQRFQKEAILRQMQEYKREKSSLESRLSQMSKAATFHNDHLRVIDLWFKQVGFLIVCPGQLERNFGAGTNLRPVD
jgi:hypothetical protein